MPVKTLIKHSAYHDSVSLMLVARDLSRYPGVQDAAVLMATEANKAILRTMFTIYPSSESGLFPPEIETATPNDLVIAVSGQEEVLQNALEEAEKLLQKKQSSPIQGEYRFKTLRGSVKVHPGANVAVISVTGRYAAAEAWDALHLGLHVLLFSDNVSIEDEIALKQYASQHGLLLMGPGAGTALLNGVALGFANAIPAGPVGIVSAAGTGLQEVSTLLAKNGIGITQGIGTGGRDLKEQVGGIMMLDGLKALQVDPATKVILLVSKPPAASVAQRIFDQAVLSDKPTVVCFLGEGDVPSSSGISNLIFARTLQESALLAARGAGAKLPPLQEILAQEEQFLERKAAEHGSRLKSGQRFLRGLFSGGTLCYEAQVIWRDLLPEPVISNAPLAKNHQLLDATHSQGHTAIDLGEEEFTVGRPHPMIDNDLRIHRLLQEAHDPQTAVIMLDVVLGYGAHPDPASELAPVVRRGQSLAQEAGRELVFVASVTGATGDPQGLVRQVQALESAGVVVCDSNAAAARLVAKIVVDRMGHPVY